MGRTTRGLVGGAAAAIPSNKQFWGGYDKGQVGTMDPAQLNYLRSILTGGMGEQAGQAYQQFLQGPEGYEDMFQKAFVDPAMKVQQEQILPGIQQKYVDQEAGSSSALNQALSQSATDLSTMLGTQFGQFYQGQQTNQLEALRQLLGLTGQQTFQPYMQQRQGLAGPLMQAGGQIGAGYMMSSRHVKENIREYKKGLEELNELDVKQFDYIKDIGGEKNRVGLIAEDVPNETTAMKDGILHVDLYGIMGLMINAIKELSNKVEQLEAK